MIHTSRKIIRDERSQIDDRVPVRPPTVGHTATTRDVVRGAGADWGVVGVVDVAGGCLGGRGGEDGRGDAGEVRHAGCAFFDRCCLDVGVVCAVWVGGVGGDRCRSEAYVSEEGGDWGFWVGKRTRERSWWRVGFLRRRLLWRILLRRCIWR